MKKVDLKWRFAALVTLASFLSTTCSFLTEELLPAPIDTGNAVLFYLDEDYQVTSSDMGITGFIVTDNPNTAGFMMTSEEKDSKNVVRFAFSQENIASMYFEKAPLSHTALSYYTARVLCTRTSVNMTKVPRLMT